MVIFYMDDVLEIFAHPMKTIDGIKRVLKLKDRKVESTKMYLGASLQNVETTDGTKCWEMSSDKYVKAEIINVE